MSLEILNAPMGLISKLRKTDNSTLPSITKCKDGYNWWASFEFYPFVVGNNKSSFEAMMYIPNDFWSKTKSVVKTCNGRSGDEERLRHEIRTSEIADDYAEKFRKFQETESCLLPRLEFVRPLLAALDSVSVLNSVFRFFKQYDKCLTEGEFVILEPHIGDKFTSFIYSNGVVSSCCPDILQTFSHFSYFESNGEFVVSNLQGTFSEKKIILSSPCIHSRNGAFGDRDLGGKGMFEFFSHHKCNYMCRNWPTPIQICPSAPCDNKYGPIENNQSIGTADIPMQPPPYWKIQGGSEVSKGGSEVSKDQPIVHTSCLKAS